MTRVLQTDPQFKFRIPASMKADLEANAKRHGRSVTAEIVYRLETWRESAGGSPASIGVRVDTSEVKDALALVQQLLAAADQASEACQRLGIKIGVA